MSRMIKTSDNLCKSCKYSKYYNLSGCYCDYLCMTYKRRNCKIGYCDKYTPKENKSNDRY